MKRAPALALLTSLALAACGGGDDDTSTYRVPSTAMAPTLSLNEVVEVDESAYEDDAPEVGDVVVLRPPTGAFAELGQQCGSEPENAALRRLCDEPTPGLATRRFISRVVALPGDRIGVRDGKVTRNGREEREPYARGCRRVEGCTFPTEIRVPDGHFYVMGDNREAADDSRFWGPVPRDALIGRVKTD